MALTINASIPEGETHSRLTKLGISPEQLVKWKPELVLKAYRNLTNEQKEVFNECLVIKDGSPSLEIVLPASAAKAQAAQEG